MKEVKESRSKPLFNKKTVNLIKDIITSLFGILSILMVSGILGFFLWIADLTLSVHDVSN